MLKLAVVDKFLDYLYGAQFVVKTDNSPLTYVLSSAKLSATGHCWLVDLATYNFSTSQQVTTLMLMYCRTTHVNQLAVLNRRKFQS